MARSFLFVLAAVASYCLPIILGAPVSSDNIVQRENGDHPPGPYRRYTAIGDSYTSGIMRLSAINRDPDKECWRTMGSYAWQFARRHIDTIETFGFPACSGADTAIIEKEINSTEEGNRLNPHYEFGHPDLVSITAGGNNGDTFTGVIKGCVYPSHELMFSCKKALKKADKVLDHLQPELETLYRHAKTHNLPSTGIEWRDVFVLGYARFYNIDGGDCPILGSQHFPIPSLGPNGIAAKVNKLVLRMNDVIKAAAEAAGVAYVDIDAAFEGHRICDKPHEEGEFQDDIFYFFHGGMGKDGYAPFHPTERGHHQMMLAFERAVYGHN
ncbi:MAG: hypothetical protein OHK93_002181 [Ramalina farinacea]|uniref:SGNH hydrolase-type esterase domain-containing protein n=1 Tax=Ramalina farinacea TaxID=258253 RepID=A0AA43QTK9_9LECA|nr:hypothetical protein [Ramalina farinacea]